MLNINHLKESHLFELIWDVSDHDSSSLLFIVDDPVNVNFIP